jgi:hypothetical protein
VEENTSEQQHAGVSVQRCRGAAVADGKPPAASSSERAGGDRHFVSSVIISSKQLETL